MLCRRSFYRGGEEDESLGFGSQKKKSGRKLEVRNPNFAVLIDADLK